MKTVVKKMIGGCEVKVALIPTWTLRAEECKAAGVCRCCGEQSKHLLHGDYDGFGKRV